MHSKIEKITNEAKTKFNDIYEFYAYSGLAYKHFKESVNAAIK